MKKSKNWIQWLIGGAIVVFLLSADFTPGTKTAIIVGIFLYLLNSEQSKRIQQVESIVALSQTSKPHEHKQILPENAIGLPQTTEAQEENYITPSYKLDIHIEPWWFKLYKKASSTTSDEKLKKEIKEKTKKTEVEDFNLWGRRYHFTEYYNATTGLTARFQRIDFPNDKSVFYPVNEFGDHGYFFDADFNLSTSPNINDKKQEQADKLSIEISEDHICSDIFDKHIGGYLGCPENYLFRFPLHDIFNFLLALGQRFHEAEGNTIIKWPDQIEKKFKEFGIKYETYFEYEPEAFDIEKNDKEFFEKWGKPIIALNDMETGFLKSTEDGTSFSVNLKIFRPGENERVSS